MKEPEKKGDEKKVEEKVWPNSSFVTSCNELKSENRTPPRPSQTSGLSRSAAACPRVSPIFSSRGRRRMSLPRRRLTRILLRLMSQHPWLLWRTRWKLPNQLRRRKLLSRHPWKRSVTTLRLRGYSSNWYIFRVSSSTRLPPLQSSPPPLNCRSFPRYATYAYCFPSHSFHRLKLTSGLEESFTSFMIQFYVYIH